MNPVVLTFGPVEIRAFTAWIMFGILAGTALVIGFAGRRKQPNQTMEQAIMPWFDAIIGGVVLGLVGARAAHVGLNLAYFAANSNEIASLTSGGLDWHGAVVGGLIGAILIGLLRRVPVRPLMDAFALAFPLGAYGVWQACAASACGYGLEVRTLADYPAWLVTESPDVYGIVAPRLNLPIPGILLAIAVFVFIALLTWRQWLVGLRLWLTLIVYSLGMAVIDFFRAEYVPTWFGRRADQVLDLALAFAAVILLALVAGGTFLSRRARSEHTEDSQDASDPNDVDKSASLGVTS